MIAPGEHLGLKILKERAGRIGGKIKIESESGEGTRVILRFPRPAPDSQTGHNQEVRFPVRTANLP